LPTTTSEVGADAILVAWDQRGVRDRQAQRVAEQRRDGEPVGQPADDAGLAAGSQQQDPEVRVIDQPCRQVDEHHRHQQAAGERLVTAQVADLVRRGVLQRAVDRHAWRYGGRPRGARQRAGGGSVAPPDGHVTQIASGRVCAV